MSRKRPVSNGIPAVTMWRAAVLGAMNRVAYVLRIAIKQRLIIKTTFLAFVW
jgi:hypothetical protein